MNSLNSSLDRQRYQVINLEVLMSDMPINKDEVVAVLNKILETELAGVVRYTHFALMVYGCVAGRIRLPDDRARRNAWVMLKR